MRRDGIIRRGRVSYRRRESRERRYRRRVRGSLRGRGGSRWSGGADGHFVFAYGFLVGSLGELEELDVSCGSGAGGYIDVAAVIDILADVLGCCASAALRASRAYPEGLGAVWGIDHDADSARVRCA